MIEQWLRMGPRRKRSRKLREREHEQDCGEVHARDSHAKYSRRGLVAATKMMYPMRVGMRDPAIQSPCLRVRWARYETVRVHAQETTYGGTERSRRAV